MEVQPSDQVRQSVILMAEAEPGDYALFGGLMQFSLELAEKGEFDQALWVADAMVALASGTSRLGGGHRRRGHRGGLGKQVTDIAKLAREQILVLREEAGTAGHI